MPSEVANAIQTVLRNIISPSAVSMMKELFYVALAIFLATKHGRLSPLHFRFGGGGWVTVTRHLLHHRGAKKDRRTGFSVFDV